MLNGNNHTSLVKRLVFSWQTPCIALISASLAARAELLQQITVCLDWSTWGKDPSLLLRLNTERVLDHLYPSGKLIMLQPQLFVILFWHSSCYNQKKNWNDFAENLTQALILIQNSVNPNSLILVRKMLSVVTVGLDLFPQKRTCFHSKLSFLSSLAEITMWHSLDASWH